jgi:hypothetical protein
MRYFVSGLFVLGVLAASPVLSDTFTLACGQSESVALGDAPPSVRRMSTDRLRIKSAKGARFFVNERLEPGTLDGIGYEYCGFAHGYYLIGKFDEGLFTGVLLEAASGKVLPAGRTVKFAPDGARYFAVRQPDGLDGEEWMVYSRDGSELWMGLSGIRAKSQRGNWEYFIATFEEPRWSDAGELEATLRCAADTTKTGIATLRMSGGQYVWVPTIECPRE